MGEHVLRVGNLSSRRDFTDVRDVVRAYVLLAAKGRAGEAYNVCSGSSHSGEEILGALLRLSHIEVRTEQDPEKMRPADIPDLRGDPGKIKADTGWAPRIPLEQTLRDIMRYWRESPPR
jgi:GDP-4-dehydro-6-deoxy-D-mannose reductase